MDCSHCNNLKKSVCVLDYGIEDHLKTTCEAMPEYSFLYNSWKTEKEQYIKRLATTTLSYPSFSLHDASHSQKIVTAIELLLGTERISYLSPTDAWLILQCAYAHDIGMSINKNDILSLLEDVRKGKKTKELNMMKHGTKEEQKSAYFLLNDYMQNSNDELADDYYDWPIMVRNHVMTFVKAHYRIRHPFTSQTIINLEAVEKTYSYTLPLRLRTIIGEISASHGKDWKDIMELEYCESGFSRDYMHPRFVALMLCLGDLLDMDSNRFNPFQYNVIEDADERSKYHFLKHMSVKRFLINHDKIVIRAEFNRISDDIAKSAEFQKALGSTNNLDYQRLVLYACKETQYWFKMVEDYFKKAAVDWTLIVPKCINGNIARIEKAEIFLDGNPLDLNDIDYTYSISPKRSSEILEGIEFYNNKSLVFLRELIQNAIDTVKFKLYEYTKHFSDDEKDNDFPEFIERYAPILGKKAIIIEIIEGDGLAWLESENNGSLVRIIDAGEGISRQDLRVMRKIGDIRKPEKEAIVESMKDWFRPTGDFGIGMQSVFYHTPMFSATSISNEVVSHHRKIVKHEISFYSTRYGGEIVNIESQPTDDKDKDSTGTTIEVKLNRSISKLIKDYDIVPQGEQANSGVVYCFESKLVRAIHSYLKENFWCELVPISLRTQKETKGVKTIDCAFLNYDFSMRNSIGCFLVPKEKSTGKPAFQWYDRNNSLLLKISPTDTEYNNNFKIYYKGILVPEANFRLQIFGDISVNLLGGRTADLLTFNRENFLSDAVTGIYQKIHSSLRNMTDFIFEQLIDDEKITTNDIRNIFNDEVSLRCFLILLKYCGVCRQMKKLNDIKDMFNSEKITKLPKHPVYELVGDTLYFNPGDTDDYLKDIWLAFLDEETIFIDTYLEFSSVSVPLHRDMSKIIDNSQSVMVFKDFYPLAPELSFEEVWVAARRGGRYDDLIYFYKLGLRRNYPTRIGLDSYEILIKQYIHRLGEIDNEAELFQIVLPASHDYPYIAVNNIPSGLNNKQFSRFNSWIIVPISFKSVSEHSELLANFEAISCEKLINSLSKRIERSDLDIELSICEKTIDYTIAKHIGMQSSADKGELRRLIDTEYCRFVKFLCSIYLKV